MPYQHAAGITSAENQMQRVGQPARSVRPAISLAGGIVLAPDLRAQRVWGNVKGEGYVVRKDVRPAPK